MGERLIAGTGEDKLPQGGVQQQPTAPKKEVQPVYSPRIREALISRVYRTAKESGIPMTAWVNQVIEEALREHERRNESQVADRDVQMENRTAERSGKELSDGTGRLSQTD